MDEDCIDGRDRAIACREASGHSLDHLGDLSDIDS